MDDVLIVGAGPAGSHLAYRLASRGYQVRVFEEHPHIGLPTQCTGIVGAKAIACLPQLLNGAILREANSARFFAPSGSPIRLWKETVQAYIVDRAAFDQALAWRAEQEGATYVRGCPVAGITVEEDGVTAEAIYQGGKAIFRGRAAVLAGGFGSGLPQRLGLGRVEDFVVGAQARVSASALDEVEVYFGQEVAPGFFAWLVPTFPGKALAGLFSRFYPGLYLKKFLSQLFAQGKIDSTEAEICHGGIPLRPLSRTYGQRLLVVGGAAGQVKPTTGGGVYYGLLCAEEAAQTLDEAFGRGDFSERLLSRYQKRWQARLARELQIGYYAHRVAERLSDRQIERIFDIISKNGIHEALLKSDGFSFDWHGDFILKAARHQALRGVVKKVRGLFFSGS